MSYYNFGPKTIGVTASQVVATGTFKRSVLIQNLSANDIYIGDSTVTTATGIKIVAGGDATFNTQGDLWAVATGANSDVRYWEEHNG